MFGTEFEKEGFHYYCYYCVLLYQEKSPFLSLGTFNSSFSTVEQDPSNHPPKRIECAIKKVTFVTIKKELSCIIIELLANIFGKKKILKILKMTFMVELPAQKNRQESQKINSNFLTQQVTLSVEKKLFFCISTPAFSTQ